MEDEFNLACQDGRIAGVALLAGDKTGAFNYAKAIGKRSLDPALGVPDARPALELDTLMRIASATKLITSVAALQCVDRGLVGLGDDVRQFDPDLKNIQVLTGFDEKNKPELTDLTEKLTLRRLLSHSSGFHYDPLSPLLLKWRELRGEKPDPALPKLTDRYLVPLTTQPGTDWCYSQGIDWAGRIVERVSGMGLEAFVQANIVEPLGIKKMTFFAQSHGADFLEGHADMTVRDKESGHVVHSPETYWSTDPDEALGGLGVFTTAQDFFAIMHSLLKNDEKLLSKSLRDIMLSPQLTPASKEFLNERFLSIPQYEALGMGGCFPVGCERDHSLAGMYLVEDLPSSKTPRRPGTVAWMGMPNFIWFIDPEAEICGLFAAQLKPPDDKIGHELARLFEQTMYARMQAASA